MFHELRIWMSCVSLAQDVAHLLFLEFTVQLVHKLQLH